MTPVSKRKPPVGKPVIGIWAGKDVHDCATVRLVYQGSRNIPLAGIPGITSTEWQAYHDTDGEGVDWHPCNPPTWWMEFGEIDDDE